MSLIAKPLFPNDTYSNSLTSTAAEKYVVPGDCLTRVTSIMATNYDTDLHTIDIHIVDDGGSATDANRWITSMAVHPGQPATWQGNKLITAGQSLFAKADVSSKVNLWIDGVEDSTNP